MDADIEKKYLIIHGHFYQPPRENPWTERIDRQISASPYHDWNEKITAECYRPNTRSRRLDWYGRIKKIVNNYETISFNFGPTIFSWLQENDPETYSAILDADRISAEKFDGHGNAIAQVYNHIIMPLADSTDQETQVHWGVRDFRYRFGRDPEGIWLAETAINETTLEILIDFGFRFIILAPHQANRVRPLDRSSGWSDVSDGSVKTGFPYRCFGRIKRGRRKLDRYIDIFFYDSPLSNDISFNHLLRDGESFTDAIEAAYPRCGNNLVMIASDGEVYGHHEPFADMALSYLIEKSSPERGIEMTNPGCYLSQNEPIWEVQIKRGKKGEGTAWSCVHGVGRWKEDCGCSTGGKPEWNQKWRKPLREGFNELREQLRAIFRQQCEPVLKNPQQARNDYIEVILDRSEETMDNFISRHTEGEITSEEKSKILSQLESQHHAMLMFTSCGWFFNDISGLETTQILKYAARAIELAGNENTKNQLEDTLMNCLSLARSNIPEEGTGDKIYRESVEDAAINYSFLPFQYMVDSFYLDRGGNGTVFGHSIKELQGMERDFNKFKSRLYLVELTYRYTLERRKFCCLLMVDNNSNATCMIGEQEKPAGYGSENTTAEATNNDGRQAKWASHNNAESGGKQSGEPENNYEGGKETSSEAAGNFDRFVSILEEFPPDISIDELRQSIREHLNESFTLQDLFREEKEIIISSIIRETLEQSMDHLKDFYDQVRDKIILIRQHNLNPPSEFTVPAEIYLEHCLLQAEGKDYEEEEWAKIRDIKEIISEADTLDIPIDRNVLNKLFTNLIAEKVRSVSEELDSKISSQFLELVELADKISVPLDETRIQNEICHLLTHTLEPMIENIAEMKLSDSEVEALKDVMKLSQRFNFNLEKYGEIFNAPNYHPGDQ
jgi:alpha-amylase/alpha-mannosidase (GH57 family)